MTPTIKLITKETYQDIKNNKCLGEYPVLTYQELKEKAAFYALLEFKKSKGITNTLVWSYVNEDELYSDLYNKFLSGFKRFCPKLLFVDYDVICTDLYVIEKDDYQNSL